MKFDIIGIDIPDVDMAININEFPDPNGGEEIQDLSWQGGGKVATGIVASARLGARCAFLGAVGDDDYGKFCKEDFNRHGIATDHMIMRPNKKTTFCVVLSNKKTMGRSIIYKMGSAEEMKVSELPRDYLENTRYFFMSWISDSTKQAALIAKAAGAEIFIDADMYSPELEAFIPEIDIFVGSEFVYNAMFEDRDYEKNCQILRERGPKVVVFTFGENGCVGLSDEGYFELPAFNVEAVDTVGAGDVFHGAFLAAYAMGRSACECARLASAVSAIKCTRIGGRAGIPNLETAQHFLDTGEIDYSEIDERVLFYGQGLHIN